MGNLNETMNESGPPGGALDARTGEIDELLSACGLPPAVAGQPVSDADASDDWDDLLDGLGSTGTARQAETVPEPAPAAPASSASATACVSGKLPEFRVKSGGVRMRAGVVPKGRLAGNVLKRMSESDPPQRRIVARQRIPKCALPDEPQVVHEPEQLIQACVSEAILREQQGAASETGGSDAPLAPLLAASAKASRSPDLRRKVARRAEKGGGKLTEQIAEKRSGEAAGREEPPVTDVKKGDGKSAGLNCASAHAGKDSVSSEAHREHHQVPNLQPRERQLLLRDLVQRKLLGNRAGAAGANAFLKSLLGKIEDNCHLASKDLNRLIHHVQQETGLLPQGRRRRLARTRWITPWAATCLVGLTSCAPFFNSTAGLEVQQLQHLGIGVERYLQQEGHPPKSLEQLAEFPQDAVSWPIEFWGVRNQQGLNEVAWITDGEDDFAIVLRTKDRAWVRYDDGHVRELEPDLRGAD